MFSFDQAYSDVFVILLYKFYNTTLRKRKSLAAEAPNDLQGEIIRLKAERKMIEYIKQLAEFAEDTGQPIVLPKSGGLAPVTVRELGPKELGPAFPTRTVTAQQMIDTPIELLNNGIVRYTALRACRYWACHRP